MQLVTDNVIEFTELATSDIISNKKYASEEEYDVIDKDLKSLTNIITGVSSGNMSNRLYNDRKLTHVLKNSLNKKSDI